MSTVVSNTTPNAVLVDSQGRATYAFLKWMESVGSLVNQGFDSSGKYQGPIGTRATIAGRATLASIVQYISTGGVVEAQGIDFALAYLNKDTDHISDGLGSPLAGGKAAYTALIQSPPTVTPHEWVRGLAGGLFIKSQPAFTDLSGTASPTQIPSLDTLSGQIAESQLPAAGLTVTVTTAALTLAGTQGSMTFQNGILVAQVQAT